MEREILEDFNCSIKEEQENLNKSRVKTLIQMSQFTVYDFHSLFMYFTDIFLEMGVRDIGYKMGDIFVTVPEMIPSLIVPDLKDCEVC